LGCIKRLEHCLGYPLAAEINHVIGAERVGFAGPFDKAQDHIIRHVRLCQLDNLLQIRGQLAAAACALAAGPAVRKIQAMTMAAKKPTMRLLMLSSDSLSYSPSFHVFMFCVP